MDKVAYDKKGQSYLVKSSIIDPESEKSLIIQFKSEGLTDNQIRERFSEIERLIMDETITKQHPNPDVRKTIDTARRTMQELSEEDLREIYAMTQQTIALIPIGKGFHVHRDIYV